MEKAHTKHNNTLLHRVLRHHLPRLDSTHIYTPHLHNTFDATPIYFRTVSVMLTIPCDDNILDPHAALRSPYISSTYDVTTFSSVFSIPSNQSATAFYSVCALHRVPHTSLYSLTLHHADIDIAWCGTT